MALCRQFLPDTVDVGLELGIVIYPEFFPDWGIVLSPDVDFRGLVHENNIGASCGRIGGASGSEPDRRGGQKQGGQEASENTVAHGLNRAMLAWPDVLHAGAAGLWTR